MRARLVNPGEGPPLTKLTTALPSGPNVNWAEVKGEDLKTRPTGFEPVTFGFVALKSPYTLGHVPAVADLAAAAGARIGPANEEVQTLRRAGLVHDLGRLGVSNAIWDKRGPLGTGERERVRTHPYLTERMLRQSEALAPLAAIAVQHCERLDGSGYPRGLFGAAISRPARILAAADVCQAMREPRPHRPERSPEEAARELRAAALPRRGASVSAPRHSGGSLPRG